MALFVVSLKLTFFRRSAIVFSVFGALSAKAEALIMLNAVAVIFVSRRINKIPVITLGLITFSSRKKNAGVYLKFALKNQRQNI
jgi:hypothetical protein